MRSLRTAVAGLVALSLAACTTGGSPSPSVAPATVTPTEATSAVPSPAAAKSPAAEALQLAAAFDGSTCSYTGPSVIPDGTLTKFSYAAADGAEPSALIVVPVVPGTTWEQIVQAAERPFSDVPDFVLDKFYITVHPGGAALLMIRSGWAGTSYGGYNVGCAAPDSDRMFPAALIEVGAS